MIGRHQLGHPQHLLSASLFLLTVLVAKAPGCDENLLRVLAQNKQSARGVTEVFDLAGAAAHLAGSLQTVATARPAGQAVWNAWLRLEALIGPASIPSAPLALATLSQTMTSLRSTLEQENLLAAHDLVKNVFYSALDCLPREDLPPAHRCLLEVALALQQFQSLALSRNLSSLGPALEGVLPKIEALPGLFRPLGPTPTSNLVDLGRRLLATSASPAASEEQLLLGISLMKDEFAVYLRTLATDLATPGFHQ